MEGHGLEMAEVTEMVNDEKPSAIIQAQDERALVRVGKKPILKRNFGFMAILGFSCTILVTWEGALVTFIEGFSNGGPAGVIYSFIFVWAGTFSTFTTISELASMAPTSGGQYHWTSMLAPRSSHKYYSFLAGWLTVLGWLAAVVSASYFCASLIQGLIILTDHSYDAKPWQITLIFWAVIAFAIFINVAASTLLPKFEGLILILHIVGFFAILIPLSYMSNHNPASMVFTTFINGGDWQTQGLSFFVGMLGNMYAFTGADAAIHMSEEIHNAAVVVPRSILTSIFLNGVLGFGIILASLFAMTDIDDALMSATGYPFMEIFLQATHSRGGSAVMAAIPTALAISATVGGVASCSRMMWSFARDRGLPGWRTLSKVSARTSIPVYTISVVTIISCLLSLIIIGSGTVLNDLVSLSVGSLYSSYLLCTALFLYCRCTGRISDIRNITADTVVVNTAGAPLAWGPFRVPGAFGIIVNVFTIIYLVIGIFFSFWPPNRVVTASTMNFSVVGTVGIVILSTLYYLFFAKGKYNGPVVEVN